MSLSDIMGHLNLDVYAQIGIVLFLSAFVAIAFQVFRRSRRETTYLASLPLGDDADAPSGADRSAR